MQAIAPWTVIAQTMSGVSPRIKFEVRRKSVHVLGAIIAVFAFLVLPFAVAFGIAALIIVVITVTHFVQRHRIKVAPPLNYVTDPIGEALEKTRRPHENFPWAPVLFTAALMIIGSVVFFLDLPKAFAFAAFGILGVGDAASALIGIAYGAHKLPWNRSKSWEGSGAGFAANFVAALVLASVDFSVRGVVLPVEWVAVALAGAVAGALTESMPHVEDNLFVPVAALAAMLVIGALLGVT